MDDDTWTAAYDSLCLSLALGTEPAATVRLLCPADLVSFTSAASASDWVRDSTAYDRTWLAAGRVGDWTFVWEVNGFQGADPELAVVVAAETTFVSMFWNVNSVMSFTLAETGRIVRRFDPLFHDDDPSPVSATGDQLHEETGLDWDTEPRMSGLAVLSRVTGTEPASPTWLALPGVSFWGHTF